MFKGTAVFSWGAGVRECCRGEEDDRREEGGRRGRRGVQRRFQQIPELGRGGRTFPLMDPLPHTNPTLTKTYREQRKQVVEKYRDVFSKRPGHTQLVEHLIRTKSEAVSRKRPY
ncbi:hypothetical protein NDU88_002962 [Pleurodeles waltl]|uniref:Uncharacterized protein n=1 Tax=Pleurodeles waltl TaxID=8319 RepID=A0AAV7PAQ5_PLEWA|nr:hypothetical protein NDU88_002962 [Pleurodeles waltl]